MIIERFSDIKRLPENADWLLIYGRRKTGKTFFVKRWIKPERYYFVRRDGSVITKDFRIIEKKAFLEKFLSEIEHEFIAIDEFHRLGFEFIDLLHALGTKGKLVLISSTCL